MTYERACELLDLTTPKSLQENARLAKQRYRCFAANTPLRFYVAACLIIRMANDNA